MATLALAACASTAPPPPETAARPLPPPVATTVASNQVDVISFRLKSWGATVHFWRVNGSGEVMWQEPEGDPFARTGSDDPKPTIVTKRFQLGDSKRAALFALLPRAEAVRTLSDDCDRYIPDGPYGTFSWSYAGQPDRELKATASCMKGPQRDRSAVAFEADHIVSDAAKAAPVTDGRDADDHPAGS